MSSLLHSQSVSPVLIFDLDGTLVDTAPDLIHTLNHLLESENCPPAPEAPLRAIISEGARAMLVKGFELGKIQKSDRELDRLLDHFVDYYSANIAVRSRPFPGLIKALDELLDRGILMGVCTNKRESLSNRLLEELSMDHYFKAVIGVDTLDVKKPHPGHVLGTIEAVGASPHRAIMVGDSETDIKAAKAAKIPVLAVDFGYSVQPVRDLNPDATLSHYDDFIEVMTTLSNQGDQAS